MILSYDLSSVVIAAPISAAIAETHMKEVLRQYGCSEQTLQWLAGWAQDFAMDAMLCRFVSGERDMELPVWPFGTYALLVTVEELNRMCKYSRREAQMVLEGGQEEKPTELKGRRISRI